MSTQITEAQTSIADAEAAIYAELTAGDPPPDDFAEQPAAESAPPPAATVPAAVASEPAPTLQVPPTQDLAAVVAQMVRREAEAAAQEQARRASAPPPQPQFRDTISSAELRSNPINVLRAAGIAPEHMAQFLVAELAPHAATPEARARLQMAPEVSAVREYASQEINSLRQELDTMRAQERTRDYERSLHKFTSGVSQEKFPLIGRLAKDDPDGLAKELLDVAREDARVKYLNGESGAPMTAEQAAQALEARYASYARRFQTPPAASTAQVGSSTSAKPAPAATIASMSGAPPVRTTAKTLEEIEREIYNESVALASRPR